MIFEPKNSHKIKLAVVIEPNKDDLIIRWKYSSRMIGFCFRSFGYSFRG